MPRYEVTSPDGKRYEINAPDGASEHEVLAYAQKQFRPVESHKPADPMEGIGTGQRMLEGIGQGMVSLGRGIGQRLGMVAPEDVAEARKVDAPLLNTGAGTAGSIAGNLVGLAPALLVPGANTVAGAAAVGGLSGLVQPTVKGESVGKNVVTGAALGGGAQYGLGKLAGYAGNRLAAAEAKGITDATQNATKDATTALARESGFTLPPAQTNPTLLNRLAEGYAGKISTQQGASIKNQPVIDRLIKQDLGIPADRPVTLDAIKGVRTKAYQAGYEPIKKQTGLLPDEQFATERASIGGPEYDALVREVPEMANAEVGNLMKALDKPEFSGSTVVSMVRKLRHDASANFKNAQNPSALEQARAQMAAADALEGLVERNLAARGMPEAVEQFRAARQMIAKTHDAERALDEATGSFAAKEFAKAYDKGKPLSGGMKTVGQSASAFPKSFQTVNSSMPGVSPLDYAAVGGISAATGMPGMLGAVIGRPVVRSGILSPQFQKMQGPQSYGPGLLDRLTPKMLEELERQGVGGLLGSVYAAQ